MNDQIHQSPTVFIVDKDTQSRESLKRIIEGSSIPVEMYSSVRELLSQNNFRRPGCLIFDIQKSGDETLIILGRLRRHGWKIPLIAISSVGDIALAVQTLKNGANTFLVKPVPPNSIVDAIHSCFEIDRKNHEMQLQKQLFMEKLNRITEREKQVMLLTVDGYGSEEIALALGISKRTAEKHKANMMHKLGIQKLSQLIRAVILYQDDKQNRH